MEHKLLNATRENRVEDVRALLRNHPALKVNFKRYGDTALHRACNHGLEVVVRQLLAHPDVDVNVQDDYGQTPLAFACVNGRATVAQLLLQDGRVDVSRPDGEGRTPLFWAAKTGALECIKWQLVCGRDVAHEARGRWMGDEITALEIARKQKNAPVAALLERFAKDPAHTRAELRKELAITEFAVVTPPTLTRQQYVDFLDEKPVTVAETSLARFLGVPLSVFASSRPETFADPSMVTSLSLAGSKLPALPERLSAFTKLVQLDLSNNPLPPDVLVSLIKKNTTIQSLNFSKIPLNPAGMLAVIQALVHNLTQGNFTLQMLVVDDVELPSFQALGMIPVDILRQGSQKVVQYMLDLYRSPDADPLYRTKLMVVGFESVGKTTIIDCLFPLGGVLTTTWGLGFLRQDCYFTLQGSSLSRFKGKTPDSEVERVIVFENRQWEVTAVQRSLSIRLTPRAVRKEKGEEEIELLCPDGATFGVWLARLRKVCMNEATHGIEIQFFHLDNEVTREYFREKTGGKGKMELSVWDFAGQYEYYNNHHYFLSARTVFLVLWKLSDGDEGLKGLEFWLRSLATHLSSQPAGKTYFSVIVVGTFLDHPSVRPEEKNQRAQQVDRLGIECDMKTAVQYFEVSCSKTLENIDLVQECICKTALSNAYMGERVPQTYLRIEAYIKRLREERRELPIMQLEEMNLDVNNLDLTKRALSLLSLWGECLYFDSPPELASIVILDPRFLAKGILADLFTADPTTRAMRKDGVIRHADLVHIWKRFTQPAAQPAPSPAAPAPSPLAPSSIASAVVAAVTQQGPPLGQTTSSSSSSLLLQPLASSPSGSLLLGGGSPATSSQAGAGAGAGVTRDFASLASVFITLLETLGVCFVLAEDRAKRFMEQRSVIPALLPETPLSQSHALFAQHWPKDPPVNRPIQIERVLKFSVVPPELVSRLIVRLHAHIQSQLVAKFEAVILMENENAQAWIRAEMDRNRFVVLVRGSELRYCNWLQDRVLAEVKAVGGSHYESVLLNEECVRSPHFLGAEIDLRAARADATLDLAERALTCPETRLPVRAERLLLTAGLSDRPIPKPVGPGWWNVGALLPNLSPKGERRVLHLVTQGGVAQHRELSARLRALLLHLGADPDKVARAYAIENPTQRALFEAYRNSVSERAGLGSGGGGDVAAGVGGEQPLFRREGWRLSADAPLRRQFLLDLAGKICAFRPQFNDGHRAFLLPVAQGTSEAAALRILRGGFAPFAVVEDGQLGKGVYFTSSMRHAARWARPSRYGRAFLVSLAIPGNPYPATEQPFLADPSGGRGRPNPLALTGQACHMGYQSHYAEVDTAGVPITSREGLPSNAPVYDELVVFEGAQALPLFLVFTSEFDAVAAEDPKSPVIEDPVVTPQKGWGFLARAETDVTAPREGNLTRMLEELTVEVGDEDAVRPAADDEVVAALRRTVDAQRARLDLLEREVEAVKSLLASTRTANETAQRWSAADVGQWLQKEGLAPLAATFVEQGLDGAALFALHLEVRKDPCASAFASDCDALGVTAPALQLRLKGKLSMLFG